jgi:2-oxoglutarate dehydrogenase E2 component (dihydrolipoamide succinyltransferase)
MSTEVKVPASGESVTSANVARWHKANGDMVHKGDILVTLETDKVSNELEAAADGVLEILVGEGEEVPIGALIARIGGSGSAPVTSAAPAAAAPAPAATPAPVASTPTASPAGNVEIRVPASGESVTSANVASWRKKDGDAVSKGEVLVVLETDKVSNELEAPASGTLKILIPEGEEVGIGTLIATVDTAQTTAPISAPATPATPSPAPAVQAVAPAPAPKAVEPAIQANPASRCPSHPSHAKPPAP